MEGRERLLLGSRTAARSHTCAQNSGTKTELTNKESDGVRWSASGKPCGDVEEWKLETLCDLYETVPAQAVIFCNTQRTVEFLADQMTQRKFTVSAMHGDMEQKERDMIMREFRSGSSRVLITTDLPPDAFGCYFYGVNQTSLPVGDGVLCITNPFFRLPVAQADSGGTAMLPLDVNNLPQPMGAVPAVLGESWAFQAWHRDMVLGLPTSNFTDGVRVDYL